jgi:hypothetical protein
VVIRDQRREFALLVAVLVVAVLACAYRVLTFVEFSNDDFMHMAFAQQIAHGSLPVRDYVELGLPLMALVSAGAQLALGEGLLTELFVEATAYAVTAALCLFVAARVSGSMAVGIALSLVIVLCHPVSYGYPKLLTYAAGLAAVWAYCAAPSKPRLGLVAVVVAAAFLFRHDHGVILAPAVVIAIVARHGWVRHSLAEAGRFAGTALLLVSPYLVWVQVHEGLWVYVADGVTFSQREAEKATWGGPPSFGFDTGKPLVEKLGHGPVVNVRWAGEVDAAAVGQGEARHRLTRLEPVGPGTWQYELSDWSPEALERLVRDPAVADTHHIDRGRFALQEVTAPEGLAWLATRLYGPADGMRLGANAVAAFYYLVWLLPAAALLALVPAWRLCPEPVRVVVAMAAVAQIALNLTMLRDPLENRIREVLVPASALAAFFAGRAWNARLPLPLRLAGRTMVVATLLCLIVGGATLGGAAQRIGRLGLGDGVEGLGRRAAAVRSGLAPPRHRTGDRLLPEYAGMVDYIRTCTPEGTRLFVVAYAPEILVNSGRAFAGGHGALAQGSFIDDRNAGLMVDRLSREDVPLVVLDSQTRDEVTRQYPRVMEYVFRNYHDVARVPVGVDKFFDVLAENRRPVVRTVGDDRRPCFL